MKKIIFITLTLILIVSGCAKTDEIKTPKSHPELPVDEITCIEKGGEWRKIGIAPVEQCNLKTSDFGRECSDSDECEGSCMVDLQKDDLSKVQQGGTVTTKGLCSEWIIIIGCQTFVEDGKVSAVTCID